MDGSGTDAHQPAEVLRRYWGVTEAVPEAVTIGVNRKVWRAGESFLGAGRRDEGAGLRAEQGVCVALTRYGLPFAVPAPIPAVNGDTIVEYGDLLWWRTRRVPGTHPDPTNVQHIHAVASGLARLHRSLQGFTGHEGAQDVSFIEWPSHTRQFLTAHPGSLPVEDQGIVSAACDLVDSERDTFAAGHHLVHGDPSFPNLLCDIAEDTDAATLTGLVDWQESAIDSPLADLSVLGSTVHTRSKSADPVTLLTEALETYNHCAPKAFGVRAVLIATLVATLQGVAHHGTRYAEGRGPRALLATRPQHIANLLADIERAGTA